MGCCASNPSDIGTSRTASTKRNSAQPEQNNRRSSSLSPYANVQYYEVGANSTMDEWFAAYDKAISYQPDLFASKVISVAPPEVANSITSRPSSEQPELWKRYAFATIPKEGLLTLDTIFLGITKRDEVMKVQSLELLRKKFGKLDNVAHFIYLMSALTLCGRQEEFRQQSPSRVRQNFKVDEWVLELSSWRAGWISLQVYSWKEAKDKVNKMILAFDKFTLVSDDLALCVRFAYLFSRKDSGSGTLDQNTACALWTAFLKNKWELVDEWNSFILQNWSRTEILQDQWDQVVSFARQYPTKKSIQGYDPVASYWPLVMDAFAQHLQSTEGKDRGASSCNDEGESNFDPDDQRELA